MIGTLATPVINWEVEQLWFNYHNHTLLVRWGERLMQSSLQNRCYFFAFFSQVKISGKHAWQGKSPSHVSCAPYCFAPAFTLQKNTNKLMPVVQAWCRVQHVKYSGLSLTLLLLLTLFFFNRSLWLNILFIVRLLLWDLDERRYSYYIEVSCDQQSWVRVVDKTKEECRSELLL